MRTRALHVSSWMVEDGLISQGNASYSSSTTECVTWRGLLKCSESHHQPSCLHFTARLEIEIFLATAGLASTRHLQRHTSAVAKTSYDAFHAHSAQQAAVCLGFCHYPCTAKPNLGGSIFLLQACRTPASLHETANGSSTQATSPHAYQSSVAHGICILHSRDDLMQ